MPEKEEKLKANLAMNLQYLRIRHNCRKFHWRSILGFPHAVSLTMNPEGIYPQRTYYVPWLCISDTPWRNC